MKPSLFIRLCLAVFVSGSAFGAKSEFNVDVFFGWGGYFRPMEWIPVEIGVTQSNQTEPFAGSVILSAPQDGLNRLNVTHQFVLTPDVPVHLPLVTKLAYGADKCVIRIADENGNAIWQQEFDMWDFRQEKQLIQPVHENDLLIGVVGQRTFGLFRLAEHTRGITHNGVGKVYLSDKLPRMVPWDWAGFASLDLLILYDPDWELFNAHQLKAIMQWVSNGGKLLIVSGSHPLLPGNPLAQWLPVEIHQARQIELTPNHLSELGLNGSAAETIVGYSLMPRKANGLCHMESGVAEPCLFAAGYVDFGRVGVLGFDPAGLSASHQADSDLFWVHCLKELFQDTKLESPQIQVEKKTDESIPAPGNLPFSIGGSPKMPIVQSEHSPEEVLYRDRFLLERGIEIIPKDAPEDKNDNRYMYETGFARQSANQVMEHLYDIPEMRPLSIGWVLLVLVVLAMLLGPVDYILLKRLDRLPLTWLTSAGYILLFTAGAYYGVQALRGGMLQVRAVSVQDGIQDCPTTWRSSYCGLFAPTSDDYQFDQLAKNQWWSGISPEQSNIYYRGEAATRNIFCVQQDGGNLPFSLPVNIWSMQCLLSESPADKLPFTAEVRREGTRIAITVTNYSSQPLEAGYVLLNEQSPFNFGSIPAMSARSFEGSLEKSTDFDIQTPLSDRQGSLNALSKHHLGRQWEAACVSPGTMPRTRTIRAYLAHGAALVCVWYDQPPLSYVVKNKKCQYNHIGLARQVVFPKPLEKETQK
jgi:hypothetical protein